MPDFHNNIVCLSAEESFFTNNTGHYVSEFNSFKTMGWIFLLIAGVFEMGWPLGFKLSQVTSNRVLWIVFAVISMAVSGVFLWLAQRTIPIGTAYAVWTGIGAVGTFTIGIIFFKDSADFMRLASASLIILGVIGLKFAN